MSMEPNVILLEKKPDDSVHVVGLTDRELLERVLIELKEVRAEHADTVAKVNGLLTALEPYIEQVGPMIDALASNPMFRMLAGGKKK